MDGIDALIGGIVGVLIGFIFGFLIGHFSVPFVEKEIDVGGEHIYVVHQPGNAGTLALVKAEGD